MRDIVRKRMLEARRKTVDICETCGGEGYLPPTEAGVLNPCQCMIVLHYLDALIEAKVPQDYWWSTLENLTAVDKIYRDLCTKYVSHLSNAVEKALGLFLYGANGIGKTSLQCVIGKAAVVAGYSVQYLTATQLIEAQKNRERDADLLAEYESGNFILLDEVDKVYIKQGSAYVPKSLEEFLRRVISAGSAVVICGNQSAAMFKKTFGESTASMLERHLKFVAMKGQDHSSMLQDEWMDNITTPRDYYGNSILTEARTLWNREQEEEDSAWEKAH